MTRDDIDKYAAKCAEDNMVVPIDHPFYPDDYKEYKEAYIKTFKMGVEYADSHPKSPTKSPWISVKDDLPYNHKDLVHSNYTENYTDSVLVMSRHGYTDVAFMSKMEEDAWEWSCLFVVLYWMPIPKLSQD